MSERKNSVLNVLEILQKYSDKKHLLTYAQIIEKLKSNYEIEVERKTVARDVDILLDNNFDIVKCGNKGLYLGERKFTEGELLFLVDAIYSSRSIPTKYAKDMVEKLMEDCSVYEKKKFNHLEKLDDGRNIDNKQIFYTIELLNEAIEQGKKMEFQYNVYGIDKKLKPKKDGKVYKVNPYFLVNNHGKYYLVCNYDKYDNLGNYKIDCISNIKVLDEKIKPLKSLPGQEKFSIKQYMEEHIYMLAGSSVRAKIKIENEDRINDVIGWFGEKIHLYKNNNKIFADFKINEDALIYWAMQYGQTVEVVEPKETRDKIKKLLNDMLKRYGGWNGIK